MGASSTITNLIPTLYEALDVVSREQVGFIPAVTLDADVARAAVGQSVLSFVAPVATGGDVTPGIYPPDDGDQVIGNVPIVIQYSKYSPIRWNGEQSRGLDTGPGRQRIRVNQVAQSVRYLCNLVEASVALAANVGASRAIVPASSTLYSGGLNDAANVRKILIDNGAPLTDLQQVINTTTGAAMGSLTQLTKANEAGTSDLLRQGILGNILGMDVRQSAQLAPFTHGSGASYVTTANYGIGATSIGVGTGSGTIKAGDVVQFGGDSNYYVVATALASGTLVLANPGLLQANTTGTTVTVHASYNPNTAFARSAIVLSTRAPALPEEGDSADDRELITDPRSGLTFELSLYKQYKQVKYELAIAWGVAVVKPEHLALMLG